MSASAAGTAVWTEEPRRDEDAPLCASSADLTEVGDAARFAAVCGERVRYVPAWGQWLVWDGTHWVRDLDDVRVTELAKAVGREWFDLAGGARDDRDRALFARRGQAASTARGIRALLTLARGIDGIAVEHEVLDADPWLFGAANGVIDLRTGALLPPDPARLMTMQSPILYDPSATCPRWGRALAEWFPDAGVRDYVQRLVGASLVGVQRDHIFVIHFGGGRNGKGSFTRAIATPFGPYFVTPHISLVIELKHAEHDTVKADLFRVRLAVASETDRRVRLAEASVKNLTGGDLIRCRRLYENPWSFTPTHHLWLQTNYLPAIRGRDRGIWSRLRVIPWEQSFDGRADPTLDDALRAEAPGILAWAVAGCLDWQRQGLAEPEQVVRATLAYREAEDMFARFATDYELHFAAGRQIPERVLTEALDAWAKAEGVTPNRRDFRQWLEDNGARKGRIRAPDGSRPQYWMGVGTDGAVG